MEIKYNNGIKTKGVDKMKAVEFDGSLRSFAEVCRLVGYEPKDIANQWIQKEGGNEMDILILDTTYRLTRGDMLVEQNGRYKVIEGELPE